MSIDEIKLAFDILQTVATLGIGAWLYLEKKRDTTTATIEHLKTSVDARLDNHATTLARLEAVAGGCEDAQENCPVHAERLAKLEAAVKQSPTHDDLGRMHEKINQVSGQLKELTGEFSGVRRTLDLIHEHLLKRG